MPAWAYYNDSDKRAGAWLEQLIHHGHIAPGVVDTRSIVDIHHRDLDGFTQCHFFAGIGVWSYALRRAGWPDDRPVWTGSCPCQPFSGAGKRLGEADPRHLWPVWWPLIREHRPITILGEQVSGAAGYGWWDAVCADLEGEAYAGAAADLAAASVGAPHIRQRLYWMAHRDGGAGRQGRAIDGRGHPGGDAQPWAGSGGGGIAGGLADTLRPGLPTREWEGVGGSWRGEERRAAQQCGGASARGLGEPASQRHGTHDMEPFAGRGECATGPTGEPCAHRLGYAQDHNGRLPDGSDRGEMPQQCGGASGGVANTNGRHPGAEREQRGREHGQQPQDGGTGERPGPLAGQWADADWLGCTDGRWRPVEPGTFPLAHGVAGRVGLLRGYGNAICAPLAEEFIRAVMECT